MWPASAKYRVPRYQEQQNQQKLPQAQLKRFKMNLVHMKSLQAQTKNKSQKSLSNHHRPQVLLNMFMPYIDGPKMDWTVNYGLYHRFLKWHLMCENILECELAMLPEKKTMQESDCLEWWFWHGLVCFLELVHRWINAWYHLRKNWRVLQAPIKWNEGQIWLAYKRLARKQVSWWMVQCSTDPGCFC